ncbi:uncharacterized protein LOC117581102 [Drosophila guanche]|uniref:Uncharacterized protein n=1 Tax=Drosophila guanche TaxID=7266 RepID=A0A3B0JZJ4_DROGU|nr:uncharacterized protein LOC117581102 [Drosophila guanche]SPP78786.1 Hypothetical predicted protein [Drosophila guanche]
MAGKASQAKQDEASEDNVRLPKEEEQQQSAAAAFFESKTFRLISIFLYLGGISGLGMVLALYYLMFFDSSMPDIHLKFPVSIGGHPVQKVHEYQ